MSEGPFVFIYGNPFAFSATGNEYKGFRIIGPIPTREAMNDMLERMGFAEGKAYIVPLEHPIPLLGVSSHVVKWPTEAEIEDGTEAWELLPDGATTEKFAGKRVRVTLEVIG